MVVRPVEKTDVLEWLRMRRSLWPARTLEAHEAEMSAYFMRGEGFLSWVAEKSDKRLIGFLEASIRQVDEEPELQSVAFIEAWYVEPGFRRIGVGSLLVSHAAQWARGQGCRQMGTDCDLDDEPSVKALLSVGFERTLHSDRLRRRL